MDSHGPGHSPEKRKSDITRRQQNLRHIIVLLEAGPTLRTFSKPESNHDQGSYYRLDYTDRRIRGYQSEQYV